MDMNTLKELFFQNRRQRPECANELRDYARNLYIQNDITAAEFRSLIRELEAEGATVPEVLEKEMFT